MKRITILLLLLILATGCSPVGPYPLAALLSTQKKKKDDAPPPPPFMLTVDRLIVEGGISDALDDKVELRVDGNPVPVAGSTFTVQLNAQVQSYFLFEAIDDAGNVAERHIQVE